MSRAILADARRRRLIEHLFERGSITVGESAAEFGVTTETIRKDILHLEKMGIAIKRFGGAIVAERALASGPASPLGSHDRAKVAIAARAFAFVPHGASVFIDGGTTTQALGEEIALRNDLTVFTNSMTILGPLSRSDNRVFVVGGRLQTPGMSNVGPWAVQAMQSTNIDVAFLGTDGLRGTAGPTSASYDEADFKATVIASSRHTIVLGDSSKFARAGLFVFKPWKGIDHFVTDEAISDTDRAGLERETDLVIAGEGAADLDITESADHDRAGVAS